MLQNEKTGIPNSTLYGTIILSNDPNDYGDDATWQDIDAYLAYIKDHAPNADVIMGASHEAGYDPDDSDDDLEQEEGDAWLASMWDLFPEHDAQYR